MMEKKRCPGYVGISCVDGSCPVANQDEYEERCISLTKSCDDCSMYKGCEDCALEGTEHCKSAGGYHEEDQDIPSPERGDQDPCDGGDGAGYERMPEHGT